MAIYKNKILVSIGIFIALIGVFIFGVFNGYKLSKPSIRYARLTMDIDFPGDKTTDPNLKIQGSIKKGSIGLIMQNPYITESVDKTIYFPIVISYDQKSNYELIRPLDRSR